MPEKSSHIRIMGIEDLERIQEIYNQAIGAKFSTAHTKPLSMEERMAWFRKHDPEQYPVYVWEEDGKVAGWISFSPYREGRMALRSTAEISYYIDHDFHRRGIGTRLMEFAIGRSMGLKFKTLIAILLEPNRASIALLEKFGFSLWGSMPGIAEIDGKEYDHLYYGLRLKNENRNA